MGERDIYIYTKIIYYIYIYKESERERERKRDERHEYQGSNENGLKRDPVSAVLSPSSTFLFSFHPSHLICVVFLCDARLPHSCVCVMPLHEGKAWKGLSWQGELKGVCVAWIQSTLTVIKEANPSPALLNNALDAFRITKSIRRPQRATFAPESPECSLPAVTHQFDYYYNCFLSFADSVYQSCLLSLAHNRSLSLLISPSPYLSLPTHFPLSPFMRSAGESNRNT